MKRLALFDLDNTLLAGDSDYEWGQFLVDRGVLERAAYEAQNRAFYEQYKAGTLDIHEFLGFALRPLADHTPAGARRAGTREFMRRAHPADDPSAGARAGAAPPAKAATCARSSPRPTASSPRRSRASSASST